MSASRKILFPEVKGINLAIFFLRKTKWQNKRTSPEAGLMKTEAKSLWAATQVSISEKEEESATQHAEKGGKLEGGTLTAMAMEESLEQQLVSGAQIQ